jgi:hypothetical protein
MRLDGAGKLYVKTIEASSDNDLTKFTLDNQGRAFFGQDTRQMLNLYGPEYGIGIQHSTMYFRTDGSPIADQNTGFTWYKGGVHSDNPSDPGTGGNRLMRLDRNGKLYVKTLAITAGADLSEQFEVRSDQAELEPTPGLVVSIDPEHPGELVVSDQAYDRTVAGIISGAGDLDPGLLMSQEGSVADGQYPVALTGRVYAWADAASGPIQPGDLLTTSTTPGHLMKVSDYDQAQGAVLGKAMSELKAGKGLVLVLVSLQ